MINLIYYICSDCGSVTPIRTRINFPKKFDIEKAYCFKCKKVTNQIKLYNIDKTKKELEFKDELTEQEEKVYALLKK